MSAIIACTGNGVLKYRRVAELVYAVDLKSTAREGLGVRFPSRRPFNTLGSSRAVMYSRYPVAKAS